MRAFRIVVFTLIYLSTIGLLSAQEGKAQQGYFEDPQVIKTNMMLFYFDPEDPDTNIFNLFYVQKQKVGLINLSGPMKKKEALLNSMKAKLETKKFKLVSETRINFFDIDDAVDYILDNVHLNYFISMYISSDLEYVLKLYRFKPPK